MHTQLILTGNIKHGAFSKVEAFIKEKYMEHISLKDMADVECMSKYHFSRFFKAKTGFSPYEYLLKYRINIAKKLLLNTDCSVEKIAQDCGFESVSNFINKFKCTVGVTPRTFRQNNI